MRTVHQWLNEYGESHRNATNKALHWICVPVILWSVAGLLWSLPTPHGMDRLGPGVNWGTMAVAGALLYYARLSVPLSLGALPAMLAMLWSFALLDRAGFPPVWMACALMFLLAWIGQFVGHAIEGRRPSFFKDVQFLMIGPLWLLADLYRRVGIRF